MTWDLEKGVLSLAIQKELLQLDALLEKGILDAATVEDLMEEVVGNGDSRRLPQQTVSEGAHPSPASLLQGRYKDLQPLGHGAMADVYKALDTSLNRHVALKLIRPEAQFRSQSVTSEARAQARIDHPNVCKVYEVGELDGRQFIAMHYINGKPLREVTADLPLEKMVWLFQQITEAVHAAHRVGVIHRDLKPTNILVEQTEAGEFLPYVMDFGLARELSAPGVTSTGVVLGTPWYMSPEQARGEVKMLDRRSDVFSLGATFYEVLTGRTPFQGQTTADVLVHLLEKDPVPVRALNPAIPRDLQTIIMKCLEKEPDQRYDSARALSEDLGNFLEGEPILARRASLRYRVARRIRKHPVAATLLATALILILTTGAFALRTFVSVQVRERLLRAFSVDLAKQTEEALRFSYAQPLHNAEPEKRVIRFSLQQYEPKLKNLGNLAMGPMHYVFGRDYMMTQDWDLAKKHLDKAWYEFQDRNARAAYALTVTNAVLYHRKKNEALLAPGANDTEPAAIEKYRDLAISYVGEIGTDVEEAEYAAAWIAFLQHKPASALKKTEEVFKHLPWLYEAKTLQGEIYSSMAEDRLRSGDSASAPALYRSAEDAYEQAVKLAPSDSAVYEGLCSLERRIMILAMKQDSGSVQESYEKGLQACANALTVNPQNADASAQKAALLAAWNNRTNKSD